MQAKQEKLARPALATTQPSHRLRPCPMSHTDGSEAVCPVMGKRPIAGHTPKASDPALVNGGEGTVPQGTLIGQAPLGHPSIPQPEIPFRTDTTQLDPRLSTIAVASNIPRGGVEDEEFWQYPSPQRFFNAMQRKGYIPNADEMQAVVSIHNTVNERAWRQVMEYERYHLACVISDTCPLTPTFDLSLNANDWVLSLESVRFRNCCDSEADRRIFPRRP